MSEEDPPSFYSIPVPPGMMQAAQEEAAALFPLSEDAREKSMLRFRAAGSVTTMYMCVACTLHAMDAAAKAMASETVTPYRVVDEAERAAMGIMRLPEDMRSKVLAKLKYENPGMYAIVVALLAKMREDSRG